MPTKVKFQGQKGKRGQKSDFPSLPWQQENNFCNPSQKKKLEVIPYLLVPNFYVSGIEIRSGVQGECDKVIYLNDL